MSTQEKRFLRRELINFYLQQNENHKQNKYVYFRYNVKGMVRDMERWHYGQTLNIYSKD